jgi:hypothetical protein
MRGKKERAPSFAPPRPAHKTEGRCRRLFPNHFRPPLGIPQLFSSKPAPPPFADAAPPGTMPEKQPFKTEVEPRLKVQKKNHDYIFPSRAGVFLLCESKTSRARPFQASKK